MNYKIKETVRLNAINMNSVCDGPGIRMVLFFQGCHRRCESCHNPDTWDPNGGWIWDIDELVQFITENAPKNRVTLSGGEPLEQIDGVYQLIQRLRQADAHFDITLYTGFEFDDIPDFLLGCIDYVKTGPYRQELRTTTISYIGSTNQKFIKITGGRPDE